MDHSKHVRLTPDELTPSNIDGATIYGPGDEKVGHIAHVHEAGAASKIVIDVGGFLGIGAKPVAIPIGDIEFLRGPDGAVHGMTQWTKDRLKAMPEHTDP